MDKQDKAALKKFNVHDHVLKISQIELSFNKKWVLSGMLAHTFNISTW